MEPSAPHGLLYAEIPEVPILLRQEKQTLFRSPDCPASHPGEGWSPHGGRRDRGPTEEGERAPGHAWSPESGPRGGTPARRHPSL